LLKAPEDIVKSEVKQYLEELWKLIQTEDGGIDGMIQFAFEQFKDAEPIRSALDIANELKSSEDKSDKELAKVIEVAYGMMEKCSAEKDLYRRVTCIVAATSAVLSTYLAEGATAVSAEIRARFTAAMVKLFCRVHSAV